jgi:hypothetical protein
MIRPEYFIFIFIIGVLFISIGLISLRRSLDEENKSFEEKYPEEDFELKNKAESDAE